jgi:hypothetical protein
MSKKYSVDESHGLLHSMNILNYANTIYEYEKINFPFLQSQEKIIYVSAIIHDMCDAKYMNEAEGIKQINDFLENQITNDEINIIQNIISTMSYSKVKKNGFPCLGDYQMAYHIVREADLLTAYDFERCMIYHLNKQNNDKNVVDAFCNAKKLFENRVFKHEEDGLFITSWSKNNHLHLHSQALTRINVWEKIIKNPVFS